MEKNFNDVDEVINVESTHIFTSIESVYEDFLSNGSTINTFDLDDLTNDAMEFLNNDDASFDDLEITEDNIKDDFINDPLIVNPNFDIDALTEEILNVPKNATIESLVKNINDDEEFNVQNKPAEPRFACDTALIDETLRGVATINCTEHIFEELNKLEDDINVLVNDLEHSIDLMRFKQTPEAMFTSAQDERAFGNLSIDDEQLVKSFENNVNNVIENKNNVLPKECVSLLSELESIVKDYTKNNNTNGDVDIYNQLESIVSGYLINKNN